MARMKSRQWLLLRRKLVFSLLPVSMALNAMPRVVDYGKSKRWTVLRRKEL